MVFKKQCLTYNILGTNELYFHFLLLYLNNNQNAQRKPN